MSRVLWIGFLALVLTMPGLPARAIELNPFSAITGAVEAAAEDRSSGDIVKNIKGVTSVTSRGKVCPRV